MAGIHRKTVFLCVVLLSGLALCASGRAENFTIGKPIPVLKLKDGTLLHDVTIISAQPTLVWAKWEGGRGSIKSSLLPDEMRTALFAVLPRQELPREVVPSYVAEAEEARRAAEAEKTALEAKYPEPAAPPAPKRITGDIGETGGLKKTITGQVFITSRGGTNYKLGAVTIYVFGAKEFSALRARALLMLEPTRKYIKSLSDRGTALNNEDSLNRALAFSRAISDAEFTYLPDGPRTDTDADGRFELRHNLHDPYVIVAKASRSVGDETEHYTWVVPSSEIGDDGRILLSNKNMEN